MKKRLLSALLCVVLLMTIPLNALAAGLETVQVELAQGRNAYDFNSQQKLLSAKEMEALRETLSQEQSHPVDMPMADQTQALKEGAYPEALFAPAALETPLLAPLEQPVTETTRFKLYPIMEKENGLIVFKGLLLCGKIEDETHFLSLSYVLAGSGDAPTVVDSLGAYVYPDSTLLGYDRYKDRTTDNWQAGSLVTGLKAGTLYQYELLFFTSDGYTQRGNHVESNVGGDAYVGSSDQVANGFSEIGSDGAVSESFLLYTMQPGDTLRRVAARYGVPLSTVMADNALDKKLLLPGNTLFLRAPTNADRTLTPNNRVNGTATAKQLGKVESTEYAYSTVNLGTGNLYYPSTAAAIDEYGGFGIMRGYNSFLYNISSAFGNGFATNLDMRVAELSDTRMLFCMADGKQLLLEKQPSGGYMSADAKYTLRASSDGYVIRSFDKTEWAFNEWGQITSIAGKDGLGISYAYDGEQALRSVTTKSGKQYKIRTNTNGCITEIQKPDGTTLQYAYSDGFLQSAIDEEGNATRFAYDKKGRLQNAINALGNNLFAVEYDSEHRVIRYADAKGNTSSFTYENGVTRFTDGRGITNAHTADAEGRVRRIDYADGTSETKIYDQYDRLSTYTDKAGNETAYTYDAQHNLLQKSYKGVVQVKYTYDADNNQLTQTDAQGNTTAYAYDANHNRIRETYADLSKREMAYDERNRLVSLTTAGATLTYAYTGNGTGVTRVEDANGNTTTNTYDKMERLLTSTTAAGTTTYTYTPAGRIQSVRDPSGKTETYAYDAAGQVIGKKDPNGNRTVTEYDENGRVRRTIDADGGMIEYTYDANGNLASETNGKGETTRYEYDENDNLRKQSLPDGSNSTFTRDAKGRITEEKDADGDTNTYVYHETLDKVVEEKDMLGRVTRYTYDAAGNLLRTIRPDGSEITNTYDGMNRVLTAVDAFGITTTNTYNVAGDLIESKTSKGEIFTYTYDANRNLIKQTNTQGCATSYAYDGNDRLIQETDAMGRITTYAYDSMGRRIKETNPEGNTKVYTYDGNGNILSVKDGNGNTTTYAYDGSNRVTQETHGDGSAYGMVYDGARNITKLIDPYGNVYTCAYDSKKQLTSFTDPQGNATQYAYDNKGNIVKTTYPDGSEERQSFNKIGWLLSVTSPGGLTSRFTYDVMGNLTEARNSEGQSETFAYDEKGNLLTQTDVMGRKTTYQYDAYSRLARKETPDGNVDLYAYDTLDRLISTTDAQGRKTQYEYDCTDHLTKRIRFDGKAEVYTTNSEGQTLSARDVLNQLTQYQYDGNGNKQKITLPDGSVTGYAYDVNNQPKTETDANGNAWKAQYDALMRLIKTESPEGAAHTYAYDTAGNLVAKRDAEGNTTTYAYDSMGRVTMETDPCGGKTVYAHNAQGLVSMETAPDGSKTRYAYDAFGNVTRITYADGKEESFTYDALDRKTSEKSRKGVTTYYAYDARGNLVRVYDSTGRQLIYSYDKYNRLTKETTLKGGYIAYEYDVYDRVVREITDQGASVSYAYDLLGRMVRKTDAAGLITSYTYDANGRRIQVKAGARAYGYTYDSSGNLTNTTDPLGKSTLRAYDRDGNLTRYTDARGNATTYAYNKNGQVTEEKDGLGLIVRLSYDPFGNVARQETADGALTAYAYDTMNRLGQLTEPENVMTKYAYDVMGNLTLSATGNSSKGSIEERKTLYTYTEINKLASIANGDAEANPEGKGTHFSYTAREKVDVRELASGKRVNYTYDDFGNVAKVRYSEDKQDAQAVEAGYDTWGRKTTMTDALGKSAYSYDPAGRLTEARYEEGVAVQYAYDVYGDVRAITYPDGSTVAYARDALGRIQSMTDRDGGKTSYTYDENGNVLTVTRPDGSITRKQYDARNRVTEAVNTAGGAEISRYAYTYDNMDRVVKEVLVDKTGTASKTYAYDKRGQLIQDTTTGADGRTAKHEYAYNARGNKTKEVATENGKTEITTYTYDAYDRVIEERTEGRTTASYVYDEDGNLLRKKDAKGVTEYTYTGDNKLATTTVNGKLMSSITYDGNGLKAFELLRKEYGGPQAFTMQDMTFALQEKKLIWEKENGEKAKTGEKAGETAAQANDGLVEVLTDTAPTAPTLHQTEDGRTWQVGTSTEKGALPKGVETVLHGLSSVLPSLAPALFDLAGRIWHNETAVIEFYPVSQETLEKAQPVNDPAEPFVLAKEPEYVIQAAYADKVISEPTLRAKYLTSTKYVRILKEITYGDGISVYYEPTRYYYDLTLENPAVLAEYGNSPELRTAYAYGANAERLSASGKDAKDPAYYLYDGRGSVSETARQGKAELTLRYDAGGAILSGTPAQDRVFAHNGEEYTPQTGLTYLRARFYDPAQGRFTTEDVYLGNQIRSLSQNRYAYCENDPVNYADPSGYKRSSGSSGGSSSTSYSYSGGMHTVTTTSGWTSSSVSMSTPVWEHVTSNMSAATGYGASSTEVYGYIAGGTSYGEAAASAAAYRAVEAAARAQAAQREQARVKQATDLRRTPQSIAAARGLQELTHQKKAAQAAANRAASALKLPAPTAQQMREMLVNTGKIGGAVSAASKPTAISDLKTAASSNNSAAIFNTSALGGGTGYSSEPGFIEKGIVSVGKWMSSQLNAMPTWAKVSVGIGLAAIGVGISVFSGGALTPAVATAAEVLLGGTALGMVGGASVECGNQMQAGNGYSGQKIWEASVNGGYNGMAMSGPAAGVQGFAAGTSTSLPTLTDVGKMPDEAFKDAGKGNSGNEFDLQLFGKTDDALAAYSRQQNGDQKALLDLAKEASKQSKSGSPISYSDAKMLDEWAMEYGVPQHHQAYAGSGVHFKGGNYADHTHIYNIHVPYK